MDEGDVGIDSLALDVMRITDNSRFCNRIMQYQCAFKFRGTQIMTGE